MLKGQDTGAAQTVSGALGVLFGAASKAAQLAPLAAEDLLRHLHLKLDVRFQAQRRAASFLPRMYNAVTGADAGALIGARKACLLRGDGARQAHDIPGARLGMDSETLRNGLE
jgi:hypothetical protein